jgi:hypothetical protein
VGATITTRGAIEPQAQDEGMLEVGGAGAGGGADRDARATGGEDGRDEGVEPRRVIRV